MKTRIITILALTAISLSLAGCTTSASSTNDTQTPTERLISNSEIYSYIDPETGVNYLIYDGFYAGGITVRLNADGTPYVTPLDKTSEE